MTAQLLLTKDGSHTVSIPELNVTYHSVYGAIQESRHVFIQKGLNYLTGRLEAPESLKIFEMGFGTGLNALLTLIEAEHKKINIFYEAIDPYPLDPDLTRALNYCEQLTPLELNTVFEKLHAANWNQQTQITPYFMLEKKNVTLSNYTTNQYFDLIYFDAFDPAAQPELWTTDIFKKLYYILTTNGAFVTYSSKGIVRRALQQVGFTVVKIPGPPGKKEIIRATKM